MNKPLQIFFSKRPSKLISRIIAYFQNGISHVGFKFFIDESVSPWILESEGKGGFSYSNPEEFEKNVEIIELYEIDWTAQEFERFLSVSDSMLRETYGYLGVFGMTVVLACKKLGGWSDNPFPQGVFCSQGVYKILHDVFGLIIEGDPNERRIGPNDLRLFLSKISEQNQTKVRRIK